MHHHPLSALLLYFCLFIFYYFVFCILYVLTKMVGTHVQMGTSTQLENVEEPCSKADVLNATLMWAAKIMR